MTSVKYSYYETLGELRKRIDEAIGRFGKDTKYIITGCYGSEGCIDEIIAAKDEPGAGPFVYITSDICSG